jgi:tRNA A-37 threonylcarbamoyl transferase component Bud32
MVDAARSTWTCASCGRGYPSEFAVCPLDATPQGEHAKPGDPLIGVVLNRTYKVVRVLGQGGMARLYEAEHLRIDAKYAIKVIHDELAREPSMLARFEREAHAAGRIRSEHVVRLVDVLRTPDDRPCMVTELLHGEDLQARLERDGKTSVAEAIRTVRQLCKGVAAAHAVGVVHRDLKPSNVFLCTNGTVKVFDFGIAKIEDDEKLTRTGAVIGTAAYMAPEQARRAADAGPLADVYAIGAILYHMLTGQMPYGNLPAVSRFALLLAEEPARPRSIDATIPDGIEAVIQHAMARDTASRIASVEDLDRQLAAFEDKPVVTRTPSITEAQAIVQRAKLARPFAVAIAAASALAGGAWLAAMFASLLAPTSSGERKLIAVIGIAAVLGVGGLHLRMLQARWQSPPAITRYITPFSRGLAAGVITFGGFVLFTLGMFAIANKLVFGVVLQLLAAGAAAGVASWLACKKAR